MRFSWIMNPGPLYEYMMWILNKSKNQIDDLEAYSIEFLKYQKSNY